MSNLIKSSHVISVEDLRRIEQLRMATKPQIISDSDGANGGESSLDVETQSLKDRILQDAEQAAEHLVREAQETAGQLRREAEEEIGKWWESKRREDEQHAEEARQRGYDDGYRQGSEQARAEGQAQWDEKMREASDIVREAYAAKESLIGEAESFLVELSCRIAEKIIGRKLRETPELTVELAVHALSRRKEQGVITLCVAPAQFAFLEAAREELATAIDSQAKLQIVPDPSVTEGGCVIRSAFGSIDARIDTQLAAIRQELLQVAAPSAQEREPEVQDA
ncbi:flagellar assembly protein FliH [Cohnella zeiphila]|uniref:Flagellar assembly protein FliH n=1 Tax=Cohnella zeiphila TaxID=2761120 RepID=A0A7X0VW60_9BACL|nr:flagellar assembly protein FliH [Cohnella zeiphila]MBB6732849.1 flagellar assembly protein FliH [Cohnella zeiphila]